MKNDNTNDGRPPLPQTDGLERTLNAAAGIEYKRPYLALSRTLTYSYLFVLPLIVIYEIGVRLVNAGNAYQIRIGADVLIKRVLGLEGTLPLAALLIVVGAVIFVVERRRKLPIVPRYFAYMFGESAVYAVVLGFVIATFVSSVLRLQIPPGPLTGEPNMVRDLVLSIGAGVYEELFFRLILVSLLYGLLRLLKMDDRIRYPIAAIVGALIFSGSHYIGALGDPFTLSSFLFRFLMGLALNILFILRGFGVASMTHALYDVFVTVL
jgi:hypothetical protein